MRPSRASEDRICRIPRRLADSSTRSSVPASFCWPGSSSRLLCIRRSTPAGPSFPMPGSILSWLVFIAAVISLSERAKLVVVYDGNGR